MDHSLFGSFERCQKINEVLAENGYFLRFYERQNKFRYQIKKKLKDKNETRKELSACVVQKFNGYELLRNHLHSREKIDFVPIDTVYEPMIFKSEMKMIFNLSHIFKLLNMTFLILKNNILTEPL